MAVIRRPGTRQRLLRARRIGTTFGRVYLGIKANQLMDRRRGGAADRRRWSRFHRKSGHSIHEAAIDLGGLILKGCQFLGARADVLPPEYVETLAGLQDRVPPHPFEEIRSRVELELRSPLENVFVEFSETPVASASLAQVHAARLPDGRRVAVKVQYPGIEDLVRSDLANLGTLFRAVGFIERDFDLMPLIREIGSHVPLELDFVNEGINAERIESFFKDRDDLEVPRVHWDLTTRRVLVSDFVDGIKISDVAGLARAGIDPRKVMRSLVEAYCEQIFVHGFFHADPHPGNLMVRPSSEADGCYRVVFLDFGQAKQLPSSFRKAVVEFSGALIGGRPDDMAGALLELGFETRNDSTESLRTLSATLLDVATNLRHQTYLDPDIIRDAGKELPRMIRENPIVRIPSHLVLLGRVLGLLSGLGRTLNVKLDMLRVILPYAATGAPGGLPKTRSTDDNRD
ncbi:MAG: AarF/ABC1/UbiB kinase family protein [Myxococcota bacterium]